MIKVETIEIEEFRGIKDLKLDLKRKNFAICGPNGTGKSGVVDALEFGLTGSISRLAGTGTGGISLKEHAPHVDSRNRPDKARVVIGVFIPSLNKQATIERSVKDPSTAVITPNDPSIRKVLDQVSTHPEFVLSRRELIRYVLSTPGDRSKEIQSLLRLQQVEDLRAVLQKIANAYKRDITSAKNENAGAGESLVRALGVSRLEDDGILTAVNQKRVLLNLPPLTSFTSNTSFRDGLTSITFAVQSVRIPKNQITADVTNLNKILSNISSAENTTLCKTLEGEISQFATDPIALKGATKEQFLKDALNFLDQEACPVCDTPWDINKLRLLIGDKLKHFDEISRRRKELEQKIRPIITLLQSLRSAAITVRQYNVLPAGSQEVKAISSFESACENNRRALESFLPTTDTIKALGEVQIVPQGVLDAIKNIEAAVAAVPEPTQQDAARDFLTISQERLEVYRDKQFKLKQAEERAQLADKVSATYGAVSNEVLDGIYKEVEKEFSEIYRIINHDDELGFSARLLPSAGKLGFDVDFYGRGLFPPGAYHSEGHQDGMGFCLYLALMKHILGNSFTLAILDDVLMSVDSGHRREVCTLLKSRFPNTQFILTTHDPVWLRHMKTEGLISHDAGVRFRQWDVDHGPTKWDQRSIWKEIEDYVKNDDVRSGASLLRHFLEYIFGEICHRLRAPVEYRGDAQFQLGDLLPSGVGTFRKLLEDGKVAAESWGQKDQSKKLAAQHKDFSTKLMNANYEQWQINAAIHFNEWDNLSKTDFIPVVSAFKGLVDQFYCLTCGSFFEVVPERGHKELVKCSCGAITINLKKKAGANKTKTSKSSKTKKTSK